MTLQEGNPGSQYVVEEIALPLELERRLEALGQRVMGVSVTP